MKVASVSFSTVAHYGQTLRRLVTTSSSFRNIKEFIAASGASADTVYRHFDMPILGDAHWGTYKGFAEALGMTVEELDAAWDRQETEAAVARRKRTAALPDRETDAGAITQAAIEEMKAAHAAKQQRPTLTAAQLGQMLDCLSEPLPEATMSALLDMLSVKDRVAIQKQLDADEIVDGLRGKRRKK